MKSMAKTDIEIIMDLLFELQGNTHASISEFKSNRVTKEIAIENMNKKLHKIENIIRNYFNRFKKLKSIDDFISFIEGYDLGVISRGAIIDKLADNRENWVLVLKALLIKNTTYFISIAYLLKKLNYMKINPINPFTLLDVEGIIIYKALRG